MASRSNARYNFPCYKEKNCFKPVTLSVEMGFQAFVGILKFLVLSCELQFTDFCAILLLEKQLAMELGCAIGICITNAAAFGEQSLYITVLWTCHLCCHS